MSAILENPQTLKDAFESASEATGSAMTENEKYLDSVQGRLDLFTNSVQTMWNDTLNSDFLKFIINAGTALIKLANGIEIAGHKITDMWTTIAVVIALVVKRMTKLSWGGFFASIGTTVAGWNTKLEGLAIRLGVLKTTSQAAQAATQGLTVGMLQEKLAAAGVSEANQKLILSKVGLDAANKEQVISSELTAINTLKEAVANKSLTTAQAFSISQKLGLITVTKSLNGATTLRIAKLAGLTNAETISLGKTLGVIGATKTLTAEEIKNAVAKLGLTDATKAQTLQNLLLLASQGKLSASFRLLGMQINDFLAKNKLLVGIAAIALAIWGTIEALDAMITTLEESEEEFTDLNSKLESTESKLSDLEGKLKEVQDRMKELNEQESLTFVEQEELDRLRAESTELERQIDLTEQLKQAQQKEVNNQASKTAQQYKNANFKSGKGQADYAQTGSKVGGVAGGIAGGIAAGVGTTALGAAAATGGGVIAGSKLLGTIGTFLGGPIGTAIGVGLGALIGGLIAGGIGAGVGAGLAEGQNQVGEAMDNMLDQRKELEEEYNKAQQEYINDPMDEDVAEDYKKAEEALADYDSMMSEHLSKLDSYYSQIDLSVYDPTLDKQKIDELRKEMNDFYDTQDKWAIAQGGADAKNNAFNRIFGENAYDSLKKVKKAFEDAAEEGKKISLEDAFDTAGLNTADLDAFTNRLHDMGLYAFEAENYFHDLIEAEKEMEEISLYGVAVEINKVTEGLEKLKDAFDEVFENKSVSSKTITELNEIFGVVENIKDEWANYVDIMFSGVSSTKEMTKATEELAKAYLDDKILNDGEVTATERMTYIIQLRNIGVENAEEYVDDKIQENAYKAIEATAEYDWDEVKTQYEKDAKKAKDEKGENWKSWDDEMDDEARRKYADKRSDRFVKNINEKEAQKIADKYGIEKENLNEVIDLLEEKEKLEKKMADGKDNQGAYQEWVNISYQPQFENLKTAINDLKNAEDSAGVTDFNPDDWKSKTDDAGRYFVHKDTSQELDDSEYQELKKKYDSFLSNGVLWNQLINSEEGKKWLNADGTLKEGVEEEFAQAYEAAKQGVEDLTEQLETKITADIELKLELQTKSDLVDQFQEIYDTLADAEKEYSDNGYVSVDTLQSLLQLEPKYLSMLYDENGQLNLNKETLLQVAQARTLDMGIQAAQNVITQASEALEAGKIDRLRELTKVTYGQANANWALVKANLGALKSQLELANTDKNNAMYGQLDGVYEGVESQVLAIQDLTNKAVANIGDSFSSSGNGATESALESITKKYERKISNLENQQTSIENAVEKLEEEDNGVSKSYYEDQIDLEQQKIDLYKQEREELLKLKRTDEVAEQLWEVEHAIEESTLRMIEFRKSITQLYAEAFQDVMDAYGNKESFTDDQQSYIEKYMELMDLQGKDIGKSGYQSLIDIEKEQLKDNEKELKDLRATLAQGLADGSIEKGSEEWVQMQSDIRATEAAILDNKIALEEYNESLKQLAVDAFEDSRTIFGYKDSFLTNQQSYIEGYIDQLEALGMDVSQEIYDELIKVEQEKRSNNVENLVDARADLAELEAQGYTAADEEWQDAYSQVVELEKAVQDNDIAMAEWRNTILDMDFSKLEEFLELVQDINTEVSNFDDIVSREDAYNDDGTWTKEGITSLGLKYQDYVTSKNLAAQYGDEIKKIDEAYAKGVKYDANGDGKGEKLTPEKYEEYRKKLVDGQWDALKDMYASKDDMIAMEEARIDKIEEAVNKEVEAYSELISVKREELEAERD